MRRALVFVLASCCAVAAGLTTAFASVAGDRSRPAATCGVSAKAEEALERAVGTRVANQALRACAAKGGVRAMRTHPPTDRSHRAHATAATTVVDGDGFASDANCNDGVTEAVNTITAALAAADSGDAVLVCPGSYAGGLEVPDGVTLKGVGASQPIVGCGPAVMGTAGVILESVDGVTIQNLDFEGGGTCTSGIQMFNATGNVVSDNTINGSKVGIFGEFEGLNQLGPDNSITALESGIVGFLTDGDHIVDNSVGEVPNADIAMIFTGVFSLDGNFIEDNSLTGGRFTRYGIFMDFGDLTHAEGNDIGGHAYGVWVEDSIDVVVTRNLIRGNDYGLVNIATKSECQQECKRSRIVFSGPVPELVDGTRNWWGSASGPGDWGIGTGDEVSAEVDFFPWALNNQFTAFRACDGRITTPGNLKGTNKSDVLCGSGGADTINGRKGTDLIIANNGDDVISGKEGGDSVIGSGGDDFVKGNTQFDSIQGRGGDDVCWFNQDGGQVSSCQRFGIGPSR